MVPAVTEEILYRLIGIGLVLLALRRRWLAVLVPAVLWGFAHLAYVRDPIALRGIELTIDALLIGAVFLAFDLTTTIVAHLTYNTGLTALPLLRSGEPYFVANGALVISGLLVPVLIALVRAGRWRQGKAVPDPVPAMRRLTGREREHLVDLALPAGTLDQASLNWPEFLEDPEATAIGLWAGGRLVGIAAARGTHVSIVYVVPGWRRRYWGSRLVEALAAAHPTSARLATVVPAGNWALARFWDSLGWRLKETSYERQAPP